MESPRSTEKLVFSIVAAAGDGPAVFSIVQVDPTGRCAVHEHRTSGEVHIWPETFPAWRQAEGAIRSMRMEESA